MLSETSRQNPEPRNLQGILTVNADRLPKDGTKHRVITDGNSVTQIIGSPVDEEQENKIAQCTSRRNIKMQSEY